MAQRSCSGAPARTRAPSFARYSPPGSDPPPLNADSYYCPRRRGTEFRVYAPQGLIAFACMQCSLALEVPCQSQ